ncbi:MAG: FAD-dependent oxidoreductase [Holosporaceae bacterium]|jgi:2-oxoacid:acceptor oxidoreductase delta subunit (pyruvate/2-ketoisovalerate family)|nr:FAD-dependent oxidoreductase [Holosporaceae bacterium]
MDNNCPFATVLSATTSPRNKTGSWRTMCPRYINLMPPCNAVCPTGENVQRWLSFARSGNFRQAWNVIVQNNPFPAIMGRICYHTCEKVCNRSHFDEAVSINILERAVGDMAISHGWKFENVVPATGKKVLVVGSGPSGLAAAYFLRKFGHEVEIKEARALTGGMMRYGVPRFRLPGSIIDAEIRRITDLGVKISCNSRVSDLGSEINKFDAIYVCIGASKAIKPDMEVKSGSSVIDAVDLFKKLTNEQSHSVKFEKNVIVYGGGNTAIDAARMALRLGAEKVNIVYRKTLSSMPAHETEIHEALSEGIKILCLRTIRVIDHREVLIDKMNYDEESGILSKSGEEETLIADSVILAVGQFMDDSVVRNIEGIVVTDGGIIETDEYMMTGAKGIFAGGDATSTKRTATVAIAHGKKGAQYIDAYLNGKEVEQKSKPDVINFKKLNTSYYFSSPRLTLPPISSISMEERTIALTGDEIVTEASRCFSCGNCHHCNNCYVYCPENAIQKLLDGSLKVNHDYCKGCGICAVECPCGAIKMMPEK